MYARMYVIHAGKNLVQVSIACVCMHTNLRMYASGTDTHAAHVNPFSCYTSCCMYDACAHKHNQTKNNYPHTQTHADNTNTHTHTHTHTHSRNTHTHTHARRRRRTHTCTHTTRIGVTSPTIQAGVCIDVSRNYHLRVQPRLTTNPFS